MKRYGISSAAAYNQPVPATIPIEDQQISDALERAEAGIDGACGDIHFWAADVVAEVAPTAFVDGYGMLWISGLRQVPVRSVSAISLLDRGTGQNSFTSITWDATNCIFLPPSGAPPDPEAFTVKVIAASPLAPAVKGSLIARVSYSGGYVTIPPSLTAIANRAAWWIYQQRTAPLGRVSSPQLGIMETPVELPPDVIRDLNLWTPRPI